MSRHVHGIAFDNIGKISIQRCLKLHISGSQSLFSPKEASPHFTMKAPAMKLDETQMCFFIRCIATRQSEVFPVPRDWNPSCPYYRTGQL